MSERAKNQMDARRKAKRLAKANVEPCDNTGVDFLPFPQSMAKGCPKMTIYGVEALVNRITIYLRASSCLSSFLVATLKRILSKQALILTIFLALPTLAQTQEHAASQTLPSAQELARQFLATGVMAGDANSKENTEDQATKAVTSAEALKLLETAAPEKNQPTKQSPKQIAKDPSLRTQPTLAPQEWWTSMQQWISRDNIIFAVKATLRIVIILVMYMLLRRLINHFVTYYIQRMPLLHEDKNTQSTTIALIKTVSPIIRSTVHWVLAVLAGLLILSELNINIMPIIYSFSVIGLAISIGSQTLVKDLINGIMTLFEGNMAVGDVVTIGEFKGEVESISLRCVHLRHGTGELQTIPFSEVNHVINHSRDYGVADIQFAVAYQADLKEVERALQTTYEQIRHHRDYIRYIKGELKPLGVKKLDEWGIKIHSTIKTIPDPRGTFLSEFYRLLIPELQRRNIPMILPPVVSTDTKDPAQL